MIQCQNCQIELFTAGMPSGRDFRCAVCGRVNSGQWSTSKQVSHRGAWWSLALGVICLLALALGTVFFFLAPQWWILGLFCLATVIGLPAVYLGLRALLKIKYQNTSLSTRIAAIAGSVFGGIFGILICGIISVFGLLIAWMALSTVTLEGPEACLVPSREILMIDWPAESRIQPYRVRTSAMQISRIDFRDAEQLDESTISMRVLRFPKWITTNRQQFIGMLEEEVFDRFSETELSSREKENLEWHMVGRPETINRILWHWTADSGVPDQKSEVFQYYSFFDVGETSFGIVLIHRPAESKLSEVDIRNIFESFRPATAQPKNSAFHAEPIRPVHVSQSHWMHLTTLFVTRFSTNAFPETIRIADLERNLERMAIVSGHSGGP